VTDLSLESTEAHVVAKADAKIHNGRPGFVLLCEFDVLGAGNHAQGHLKKICRHQLPLMLKIGHRHIPRGTVLRILPYPGLDDGLNKVINAFHAEVIEPND
jgi:hypothetical protein